MATKKFSYKANIPAPNQRDADIKMKALMTMASRLNAKQLAAVERVIKTDPDKIDMALNFIGYSE